MLKLEGICLTFNAGTVNEKKALTNLSMHLEKGDFVTILGSNGAGKSTLFNTIAGTYTPDSGKVYLDGKDITNDEKGKKRKISSLRSFYNYFYENEKIRNNPASLVPVPKQHEKEIVRLEPNEVAMLLDQVEDGTNLTKKELEYHKKTRTRDIALLTLLLGTGIRVSECVGIDMQDINFDVNGIKIRRKGGNEAVVYFGEEVETALLDYLEERDHIIPCEGHEEALFLSLQNKRISVRAVENLVKKYASRVTTLKKITPHKLRSTYGTELYRATEDIYLVADVLGHKDVNTTRRHYAAQQDESRRRAANKVKLRKDARL